MPPPAASSAEPRPLRVLVVENHDDTRFLLRLLIEAAGHHVTEASSVAQATHRTTHADFDVLLSDIGLPDGTGWELVQRMGDRVPGYAIAMSGFGRDEDRQRSREAGFRDHLLKPVPPEMLERLLDDAVGRIGH